MPIKLWENSHRPLPEQNCNFPLLLAPMVGLSNAALRQICQDYLPDNYTCIWPTEMLNSRRVPHERLGFTPESLKTLQEKSGVQPLVPQILGNELKEITESIIKLQQWGATAIDINMGCPVQKALKHNYGVALMGDVNYAAGVVRMAHQASVLPVSVKLRVPAESDGNPELLIQFCRELIEGGASWLTLHPRTPEQKRRGRADWSQIRTLRSAVQVPIIGNGDIQNVDDVLQMLTETQCDYVMAGRALTARPWMFAQLAQKMGIEIPNHISVPQTEIEEGQEYGKVVLRYLDLCIEHFGPQLGLRKFRFFVKTSSVWLEFGHALFSLVMREVPIEKHREALQNFFSGTHFLYRKTELRQ